VGRPTKSGSYRVAELFVRPSVALLTKRDWGGGEHVPREGGIVVVVNHTSHADPFPIAHFLVNHGRLPRYLGKESVFRIPVGGRILRGAGQIPVFRESADASRSYSAAVQAVRDGECVVIYPEGTLTRDPDLWPMGGKTGAARVALETRCPVIPVAQWGAHRILSPYGSGPRILPRQRLIVMAGPPVDLSAYDDQAIDAPVLLGATEAIMDALTRLVEQLRGQQAPGVRWDPRDHDQPVTGNPQDRRPR
jgi:1-acyl-sn-glycerol-3-phosphate acyltransferase